MFCHGPPLSVVPLASSFPSQRNSFFSEDHENRGVKASSECFVNCRGLSFSFLSFFSSAAFSSLSLSFFFQKGVFLLDKKVRFRANCNRRRLVFFIEQKINENLADVGVASARQAHLSDEPNYTEHSHFNGVEQSKLTKDLLKLSDLGLD